MAGSFTPCAANASTLMARSIASPEQRPPGSGAKPPSEDPTGWLALNARVMCAARFGDDHTCARATQALSAPGEAGGRAKGLLAPVVPLCLTLGR